MRPNSTFVVRPHAPTINLTIYLSKLNTTTNISTGQPSLNRRTGSQGFALVIALSLMAFVLLLLLTMTTLVQVEQASSATQVQQMEAEQAALLSLHMAIGKLQETAGLDQRVTAPAESVAGVADKSKHFKHITGVWRSWEGLDHDKSTGLPTVPPYASKLDTGVQGIASTAPERFLAWLVSSEFDQSKTTPSSASLPPTLEETSVTVPLVAKGSVDFGESGDEDDEVHVVPTELADGSAAIAWWISGENTKALLRKPQETASFDSFDWSAQLASSANPNANTFEITDDTKEAKLGSVVSKQNLDQLSERASTDTPISADFFHDLTTHSRGLLTNTANGGWRRDLSLMSEQWGSLASPSGAGFPFYTLEPGVETSALKNSGSVGGLIYPWAQESTFSRLGGASAGWGALVDFATQYKQIVSGNSTGTVTFDQKSSTQRDEINRLPVLARIHWVLSFRSLQQGAQYNAYLNMDPVVTYWNPYDVAISGSSDFFWLQMETSLPYKLEFSVGSKSTGSKELSEYTGTKNFTLQLPADPEVWQPGEARVYSVDNKSGTNRYNMKRGYEDSDGFNRSLNLSGNADDSFTVALSNISGTDFKFNAYEWRNTDRAGKALKLDYRINYADAELYWGTPTIENVSQKMGTLAGGAPSPFLIEMLQVQNITEAAADARGYSHKKPLLTQVSNVHSGGNLDSSLDSLPFDVVMQYPNGSSGAGSRDGRPVYGSSDSDPYSYIGTSYAIEDGLKSLVVAEIPTRPLRSLGELQHFDLNAYNPVAPYIANPIGNSNASHMIEPNEVFVDGNGMTEPLRASYDHSYIGNHLFYDDWFVSSIAPETSGYSSSEIRSKEKVYSDFILGEESLPNLAYRPAEFISDSGAAASAATALMSDNTSWHSVASKLEVDGMFNVNSTSVQAWTALLKHLKDAEVPYVSAPDTSSTAWNVQLDAEPGYPVSRTTVAGDPSAGPVDYYSAIGEHARLTDAQVEALATEIVKQVKKRGPFLSLSEFVNRQLNTDNSSTSLALAGAVEAALAELSTKGSAENPYSEFQAVFTNGDGSPAVVDVPSGVSHAFPEAAEGHRAYGFPGWVRQADVLRPLAPVLSARDDTFVIRAYGESKNPVTGETQSNAWCEAVVQRRADYVDNKQDEATVLPSDSTLASEINKRFGRRFTVVSFRWLSPDEV